MYCYSRSPQISEAAGICSPASRQKLPIRDADPPKPKFEFTYSERYNLKRLPPEEAAAIRKKLEAEGH